MFKKISIIGCGLIGSSILRVIIKKKITKNIHVYDKSEKVLNFIKRIRLPVKVSNNVKEIVKNSDLIILAIPLSSYDKVLFTIKNNLKANAILTDTGSAKKGINKIIKKYKLKKISWIASHPIAGTEDSGPKAGSSKLFEKRWCIISYQILVFQYPDRLQ